MAKRFTDTEKWKDEWFLSLDNDSRMIWLYMLDNCSIAGILKKNFKLMNFCCNAKFNEQKLLEVFNGRVEDKGSYYFITKFLKFQYPKGLGSNKPAIIAVRKELEEKGIPIIISESLANHSLMIKDKDKDKDKVKDKDKDKDKDSIYDFDILWNKYPRKLGKHNAYKHFKAQIKSDLDYSNIAQALNNFLLSDAVRVEDKFIPHGSTWFNERWRDWVDITKATGKSQAAIELEAMANGRK